MSKILDLKERSTRRKINRYLNKNVVNHVLINEENGMITVDNFTITRSGNYYQVFDVGQRKHKFNYRKSALVYCVNSRLAELAETDETISRHKQNVNEIIKLDPRLAKFKEDLRIYQQLHNTNIENGNEFKVELNENRISEVELRVNIMERAFSKLIESTNFE